MGKQVTLTAPQIRAYLYLPKKGDINDENTRRGIINVFLRAVYLYDDRFTLILNGSEKPITIDDALLDEIEEEFASAQPGCSLCSPLVADAPPYERSPFFEHFYRKTDFSFLESLVVSRLSLFIFWMVHFKNPQMEKYYFHSMTLFEHPFSIKLA